LVNESQCRSLMMKGIRSMATNTETRTVVCEPAHIRPHLSGREYGWRRTQAMTQQFTRIPRWLTNDLLVIVVGMAIIGALAWIAPF